jgi:hypothetical protein
MTADNPSRRIIALLAVVGVVLAGAIALGTWRPWAPIAEAPAVAAPQQPVAPLPAALALPEDPEVLIFGDSWTYGSAATDPAGGYAYRVGEKLGWRTTVDGGRGSGYLKPGIDGPSYGDRIAALGERGLHPDLVVLQGSINDRRQDLDGYDAAVTAAWDELAATFPEAQIVVLGPAPHVLPVASGIPQLDRSLAALAEARGWWYISGDRRGSAAGHAGHAGGRSARRTLISSISTPP